MDAVTMSKRPRILSDHVSRDVTPAMERENMMWIRMVGQSSSEVAAFDDFTFPFSVGGINQHIVSASAIRDMLNIRTPNTTSEKQRDRVASFFATRLDKKGDPVGGDETKLQKLVRLFQPYVIATSKVGDAYTAMIGRNGNAVTGLFAGSNQSESQFHPAATVQTELRMPTVDLYCMPGCEGVTCGIFAVFDSDCSPSGRATEDRQYGVCRVRYVIAPTCDADVVHSYERSQERQRSVKNEVEHYTYEIAIRRIAYIPKYGETSLVSFDAETTGVPQYHVDFSHEWHYLRYMVCLDESG